MGGHVLLQRLRPRRAREAVPHHFYRWGYDGDEDRGEVLNKYKRADDELKRIEGIIVEGKIAEAKRSLTSFIYHCYRVIHGIPANGLVELAHRMEGKRQIPIKNPRTRNAVIRRLDKAKALNEKLHGHYISYY